VLKLVLALIAVFSPVAMLVSVLPVATVYVIATVPPDNPLSNTLMVTVLPTVMVPPMLAFSTTLAAIPDVIVSVAPELLETA